MLYNFYFEEKNENEISFKFDKIAVEKQSKDNITLREDIFNILNEYSTYLVNACYPSFKDHESNKTMERLFAYEAVMPDKHLSSIASISYGLIEYRNNAYMLSGDILHVLKNFRYDQKQKRKIMPFQ